jgi:hypothetical protein
MRIRGEYRNLIIIANIVPIMFIGLITMVGVVSKNHTLIDNITLLIGILFSIFLLVAYNIKTINMILERRRNRYKELVNLRRVRGSLKATDTNLGDINYKTEYFTVMARYGNSIEHVKFNYKDAIDNGVLVINKDKLKKIME